MAALNCEQNSHEIVVRQLNEFFGASLAADVIQRVAKDCRFDVQESSNKLLEISSNSLHAELAFESAPAQELTHVTPYIIEKTMPNANRRKSKKSQEIDNAIANINKGYKVVVLLRGLPGSGKSTLARYILENTIGTTHDNVANHILSADDFFTKNGMYQYDSDKIGEAHGWNHNRAFKALSKGYSPIIIDNTNTEMWEMKPYAIMATDYGYILEILEPDTHWCFNENELVKRNKHGVPKHNIRAMLSRFEKNISPAKLLSAYGCRYVQQKPPQYRSCPPLAQQKSKDTIKKCQSMNAVSESSIKHNGIQENMQYVVSPNKVKLHNGLKHSLKLNPFANTSTPNCNIVKSHSFTTTAPNEISAKIFDNIKSSPSPLPDSEIIDLMDFDDDNESNHSTSTNASTKNNHENKSRANPVDSLLMHCSGSPVRSSVLRPVQTFQNQKTDDKPLFGDISAWGIDENALRSWDIVTPMDSTDTREQQFVTVDDGTKLVDTNEFGVNTEEDDFYILRNINAPELKNVRNFELTTVRVLDTLSRDINRNTTIPSQGIKKILTLDKGCMTEEVFDEEMYIDQLMAVFPDVSKAHLIYWFKKCKGDLDWTIELLLAEREEAIKIDLTKDDEIEEINRIVISQTLDSDSDRNSPVDNQPFKIAKANKKKRKSPPVTEESLKLRKTIEQKIDISSDHYSEHLLKVKYHRFGSTTSNDSKTPVDEPKPGTSSGNNEETSISSVRTVNRFEALEDIELTDGENDSNSDNDEYETVELNLGDQCVEQLENHFGDKMPKFPKGFLPVVQIPVALAQQLFAFYIESVFSQMDEQKIILDAMAKEDEAFAKKLQAEEQKAAKAESVQKTEPEAFKDIIKEQVELTKFQKESEKWKLISPDTLAAKLTRQKLFAAFPSLHQDTLVEILHAHNNVYKDTVETLLASCGTDDYVGDAGTIKEPPLEDGVIKEMKDAHKKYKDQEVDKDVKQSAQQYREEASRYYKRRQELYEKANAYNQRGMTEVAMFYSGLARQQTVFFEMANGRAAQAFLNEHDKRLQDFNTLDFHFLYVKEAIPTLDVFIDRTINLLRSSGQVAEMLHVITGRGKNSEGGISKIKPAVEARLRKRKIIYQHLNPGLLKIKVTKNHLLTDEMEYSDRNS